MGQLTVHTAFFALFCLTMCGSCLLGQSIPDTIENRIDDSIESALENGTRDVEDSQYAELLLNLSRNPIDVNSATVSELQQVPGMDPMLASRIVSFRKIRTFRSVDDLLLVEGMDRVQFLQFRGFLAVAEVSRESKARKGMSLHYTERTTTRLATPRGFINGTYEGNQYKIYNRVSARYPLDSEFMAEAGALTEKDPGEKNVADFSSGFLAFSNTQKTLKCIVGDYIVEAGQGLVLWRSTGTTKGSEVIASVTKNPRGLQSYASSDENGFMRGGALQMRWKILDAIVFFSRKSVNASLNEVGCITSFDLSGLSRTSTEIQKRGTSGERVLGMNVDLRIFDGFRTGIRAYTTRFDNPVTLTAVNGFQGQNASIEGIDFAYASRTVGTFGEFAIDHKRSVATIGGIVFKPASILDVALVLHSYPQRFVSLHGFGFGGSGGELQNERGVYASARVSPLPWVSISTYFDQFASPDAGTTSLLPVNGNEFLGALQLEADERTTLQLQLKHKNQAQTGIFQDSFARSTAVVGTRIQANYRASFEWRASSKIRWKTRLELVRVEYTLGGNSGRGLLFYQDVQLRPKSRLSIDGRVVVFDTDSYDCRIYEYENELRGTFANPALYGKGIRMYVLTRYEAGAFEFTFKYSSTLKPGTKALGTGADEIQGDSDSQIGFQIDVTV